ncbi:hypothetical protein GGE07_001119 [Sinorhizobium terangae]|uniref:Anti-sigma factor NepR domain-containing protein n=1 Tax=Sinorhizobium terangae TaxID=110322 RepID=A0A6N7LFJ0_SINTE|nr:hypothetical protein [Sinorhizobium terangae]MBB4184493.1 hypothetical protein [Sinorhizobium terangae]MQX16366.1 hypothetical protein [Sinorhizobium terangae]
MDAVRLADTTVAALMPERLVVFSDVGRVRRRSHFSLSRSGDLHEEPGTIRYREILAMTKDKRMEETKARAGPDVDKAVDEWIAALMDKIQKEAVPERLLELARQLQDALNARKR